MKIWAVRFWAIVGVVLLVGACNRAPSQQALPQAELVGKTMGTHYRVLLVDSGQQVDQQSLQKQIEQRLVVLNQVFSTYIADSELSLFNSNQQTGPQRLSAELAKVLERAQAISHASAGAFDVTVGPLVNLWGFGPDPRQAEPPTEAAMARAKQRVGYQQLSQASSMDDQLQGWSKARGDVYVDLSALAKGYAVDQLGELLLAQGLQNFWVDIGGEVVVRGHNAKRQKWRVGVKKPQPFGNVTQQVLHLQDLAVATSGDYQNYFEAEGRRYSHTIDPATGWPVQHRTTSVTVIAEHCMDADAWATAMLVLGSEKGLRLADDLNLAVLFLDRAESGTKQYVRHSSKAMAVWLEQP